jgi:cell division protein FtsQ
MSSRRKTFFSRRRSPSGRRKSARGLKLLLVLALTGLSCYGADRLSISDYFKVRQVAVENTRNISKPGMESLCNRLLLGRSMLSSLSEQKKSLEREPLVRRVRFHRRFPDRLTVEVEERQPVALLNAGELLPVDREGYILPLKNSVSRAALPILTPRGSALNSEGESGSRTRLDRDGRVLLETALAFQRMAPDLLPMISEFTVNRQGKITLVTMDDGVQVVMGKWLKPETLRYLKWMMGQLAMSEPKPREVDLSFDGQIIVRDDNGI